MNRFAEVIVPFGFRIACRRASWPTSRSPWSVNATTDGVVRDPSALTITVGSPPSSVAITELVVPRSMPTALAIPAPPYHGPAEPPAREWHHPALRKRAEPADWMRGGLDGWIATGATVGGGTLEPQVKPRACSCAAIPARAEREQVPHGQPAKPGSGATRRALANAVTAWRGSWRPGSSASPCRC